MNIESFKTPILIFVFIFMISVIHAQNEYDLLGKGARAAGMGYAFNAIADDATAISWNPAGMVQIKKPEIAFVNSLKATKYNHIFYSDNIYNPQYNIDYAGLIYPLKVKMRDLSFGVSFQNKTNSKSVYTTGNDTTLEFEDYSTKLTINSLSISGAYSITRFLGIGISYNQWFSLGNKSDGYEYHNTRNWIDKEEYPYDLNTVELAETFKYRASNITAGILLDFSTFHLPLRFALKYESKFVLKNDWNGSFRSDYLYKNNIDTIYLEKWDGIQKGHFPAILAMGISYRIGDYFTIACDFDMKPFKDRDYSWDYSYCKFRITTQTDTILCGSYNEIHHLTKSNSNLNQFRIGAEYIIHPKFALIPVRAGWKNNPTSIGDQVSPKQVFAHSLNFGTGVITKHISMDLAYERYVYNRDIIIMDNYYSEEKIFHFFILSLILSF